jgi:hypothetical protein
MCGVCVCAHILFMRFHYHTFMVFKTFFLSSHQLKYKKEGTVSSNKDTLIGGTPGEEVLQMMKKRPKKQETVRLLIMKMNAMMVLMETVFRWGPSRRRMEMP